MLYFSPKASNKKIWNSSNFHSESNIYICVLNVSLLNKPQSMGINQVTVLSHPQSWTLRSGNIWWSQPRANPQNIHKYLFMLPLHTREALLGVVAQQGLHFPAIFLGEIMWLVLANRMWAEVVCVTWSLRG